MKSLSVSHPVDLCGQGVDDDGVDAETPTTHHGFYFVSEVLGMHTVVTFLAVPL